MTNHNRYAGWLSAALLSVGLMSTSVASAATGDAGKQLSEQYGIPYHAVIAHRGDSFDAPESTAPAYLLARDLGADYLELDLQRTKDGQLIAVHDDTLKRTTNIAEVFPERADDPVSTFTLAEIKQLDAGSWFNAQYPERARDSYQGLKILTLDEVRQIAEGGDNKPGLYIETKVPSQFPGIEKELKNYLKQHGWIGGEREAPKSFDPIHHVGVAFTPGRVILQTFEKESLEKLQQQMPEVPKILLLWLDDGYIASKGTAERIEGESDADFYARQQVASKEEFERWLDFAKAHGAIGTGPSAELHDHGAQSYADLAQPWMNKMTHDKGLLIHLYTVDAAEDFAKYDARGVDGFFTNHTPALLEFYHRPPAQGVDEILKKYDF
ncbi:glycerophosphodiester phosphodiesterase [Phytohalomonas tamaricis]|uniref:glycerophosphodiester phosphodiesterase n=1 Tax=Phytohalomonas tamaricis TaxID=2081032 RepID=UPI000D0B082D|nr:glycerophosphodiester phosphodiesterase [Phytohalomonas tamaricis]